MEIIIAILLLVIIGLIFKLSNIIIKLNQAKYLIDSLKAEKTIAYKNLTDWSIKYTNLLNSLTTLDYFDSLDEGNLLSIKKVINKKLKKFKNENSINSIGTDNRN